MPLEPLIAGIEFNFATLPGQLVNGILLGAIYSLIALGYTMVYGVLRLINFAHGEVYMLGAYTALLTSWALGYRPGSDMAKTGGSNWINLVIMLLASMVVCAIIGMLIEQLAYRPLRNQPRIASLITAIGVSLLIQYGGQLFLPSSPPPTISERVNPFREAMRIQLIGDPKTIQSEVDTAKLTFDQASKNFTEQLKHEKSEFDLSQLGRTLKDERNVAERKYTDAKRKLDNFGVSVTITIGQIIILVTSVTLMFLLRWLVMATSVGRGMRAVSHDFETAGLMGVNVNRIITMTFVIGSALAGAGAMMQATFQGTSISPFYGVLPGVKAFVAAVLGGIGNIPGAVVGGLLMGVAETLVKWIGLSAYADAVAFVILIVVLLFRPGGLLGSSAVEKV